MTGTTTLSDVRNFASGLSVWAHLATVGADGEPDVVPVHPCWEGEVLWVMVGADSVKTRNVASNAKNQWQVLDQYNAAEAGAKIVGAATVDLDGEPGAEIVLIDAGNCTSASGSGTGRPEAKP